MDVKQYCNSKTSTTRMQAVEQKRNKQGSKTGIQAFEPARSGMPLQAGRYVGRYIGRHVGKYDRVCRQRDRKARQRNSWESGTASGSKELVWTSVDLERGRQQQELTTNYLFDQEKGVQTGSRDLLLNTCQTGGRRSLDWFQSVFWSVSWCCSLSEVFLPYLESIMQKTQI